ncbi:hypothetical protein [Cupriavidus sp. TMH.W2]|uniref:hypothetical protein n=1 Tax=Cupriavidus sp. TMH.W2 TaxID=3434465 RepID=UPI003D776E50
MQTTISAWRRPYLGLAAVLLAISGCAPTYPLYEPSEQSPSKSVEVTFRSVHERGMALLVSEDLDECDPAKVFRVTRDERSYIPPGEQPVVRVSRGKPIRIHMSWVSAPAVDGSQAMCSVNMVYTFTGQQAVVDFVNAGRRGCATAVTQDGAPLQGKVFYRNSACSRPVQTVRP